jgi:PAS domain S-box-containing protein
MTGAMSEENELKEKMSYMESRLESHRILGDYQSKVVAENDVQRIYSLLMGLIDHFLNPLLMAVFVVDKNYEFQLFRASEESWNEDLKKEFNVQVDEEIIPWILNSNKTAIVQPVTARCKEQGMKSLIISPISAKDKVIGLLMAFKKDWENEIPQNSVEFINMALRITGLSVENAEMNTQMKEKNRELEAYREYNENIHRSIMDIFVIADENFTIREVNRAGLHYLGYSPEEIVGKPFKVLFPDRREGEIIKLYNRLSREQEVRNFDFECLTRFGDSIPVNLSCAIIKDKASKIQGIVAVIKDMTDIRGLIEGLQRARDELEAQKGKLEELVGERTHDLADRLRDIQYLSQYLSSILQCMRNGVIAVDTDLKVTAVNHAAEAMTGVDDFEILNKKISDFFHLVNMEKMFVKTLRQQEPLVGKEVVVKNKSGRDVPVSITTSLLTDPMGETRGAVAVFSDLSDIKDMHRKLIQNERMAAVGEMLVGIAHEILNPLNVIRGLSEMIVSNASDAEKIKTYMSNIMPQIDRMDNLIKEISDYVNQRDPVFASHMVMPFIEKTVMGFEEHVVKKGKKKITVTVEGQKIFPKCEFDRQQLELLLVNVMKNSFDAIAKSGEIRIILESDEEFLTIKIRDNGRGMSQEVLRKAFEAFYTTQRPQRTGLGLTVSRSIVEKHGGSMVLSSSEGEGATAEIRIPISQEATNDKRKNPSH